MRPDYQREYPLKPPRMAPETRQADLLTIPTPGPLAAQRGARLNAFRTDIVVTVSYRRLGATFPCNRSNPVFQSVSLANAMAAGTIAPKTDSTLLPEALPRLSKTTLHCHLPTLRVVGSGWQWEWATCRGSPMALPWQLAV